MAKTKLAGVESIPGDETTERNGVYAHEEPRSEAGRYVSEELYWAEYYENPDFHYEWNNG